VPNVVALPVKRDQNLSATLRFPAGVVANLELLADSKPIPPFIKPEGGRKGGRTEPLFESFAVEIKPVGGKLIMRRNGDRAEASVAPECGDVGRTRPSRKTVGPPVVRFVPGKGLTPDPIMREVHALPIDLDDLVPRTELRISGGPQDDTDVHRRFSVGDRRTGAWSPGLTMNGQGKLVMGRLPEQGASPETVVKVEGTVYLPPVGKNDPLLPVLMAQAFMVGLLQMGQVASEVTLAFSNLPETITKTEDFDYKLTVKRSVGNQTIKIKKCLEIITAVLGGTDVVISDVSTLLPGELNDSNAHEVTIPHQAFTIAATKVRITIRLLIGIGTATRVVEKTTASIPVDEP
jgi:hypothetical protein